MNEREELPPGLARLVEIFREEYEALRPTASTADIDALLEKHTKIYNMILDRMIVALQELDPRAAEQLRVDLMPLRAWMGRRVADLVRPN